MMMMMIWMRTRLMMMKAPLRPPTARRPWIPIAVHCMRRRRRSAE